MTRLGYLKALLDQLVNFVTKAYGAVAAVVGLVGFAVAAIRWTQRRRHPAAFGPVEPVEFSGRTRKAFLERVWSQRIVNGLVRSLQHAAEMYLGMRNTPELVKLSYAQSTAEPGEVLGIEAAYDQAGGQLLIVGPPGSGKTTEALQLMRHLLEVARHDPSAPVPEIFPLASWARERKPLIDWLADQLQLRHGWAPREGRSLIWHHRVVPVLDGLDEVAAEHRGECVQEINRFWESHRAGPLVLCSRLAEYEGLPERVKLGGGVGVCSPETQQIDEYLAAAGPRWDPVRRELHAGSSPYLRELLATPLMLSIAVLAYMDDDPSELCEAHDAERQREALWSQYVSAVTTRGYNPDKRDPADAPAPYTQQEVMRWLGWLASEMKARNETELWLHEWSGPPSFRRKVRVGAGVLLGVILGLVLGLIFRAQNRPDWLSFGLLFGLPVVLVVVLGGERVLKLQPAYRVPFDPRRLAVFVIVGVLGGLLFELGDQLGGWVGSVLIGLVIGLLLLLPGGQIIEPGSAYRAPFDPRRLAVSLIVTLLALVIILFAGIWGIFVDMAPIGGGAVLDRGISVGGLEAFVAGLIVGVIAGQAFNQEPADPVSFIFRRLGRSMVARLPVGMIFGMTYLLVYGSLSGMTTNILVSHMTTSILAYRHVFDLLDGMVSGLAVALAGGVFFGLVSFGPDRQRVAPHSPTQLIADSCRIGLVVGVAAALFVGLAVGLLAKLAYGLAIGLLVGLFVGVVTGLDSVLYHFAFRLWLRTHLNGPLRWVRFLEWARVRLLLRSTGATYEWAHLELRDYMAEQVRVDS